MTIAVCIACGGQKFGALTLCRHCGHQPLTPIDKAKSLMLNDHNFCVEDLSKFGALIQGGRQVPYDSVSLASFYVQFLDETYFSSNFDLANGVLPCKRCGKLFPPAIDEVYCPPCLAEVERVLVPCTGCQLLFELSARYCQKCGMTLSLNPDLTTKDIGRSMALTVRKMVKLERPLERSPNLIAFSRESTDEQRVASEFELEIVGMYTEMVVLSRHMHSKQLLGECVRDMVGIYREGLILGGASTEVVDAAVSLCSNRFHEYDEAVAVDPERWMLHLGSAASMNCVGVERHIGAALEMDVIIGYFAKAFEGTLLAVAFRN